MRGQLVASLEDTCDHSPMLVRSFEAGKTALRGFERLVWPEEQHAENAGLHMHTRYDLLDHSNNLVDLI